MHNNFKNARKNQLHLKFNDYFSMVRIKVFCDKYGNKYKFKKV